MTIRDHVDIRADLVVACDAVGFPKPRPQDGIMEWADGVLDALLLRGSKRWQEAHPHVVAAVEAATYGFGADTIARALTVARDLARALKPCACVGVTARLEAHGKRWCTHCAGPVAT